MLHRQLPTHLPRPSLPSRRPLPRQLTRLAPRPSFRTFTTSPTRFLPSASPKNTLAIIGGGLSGLSSAFYFLRALTPEARKATKVVLLEKQERTGGWCRSIEVPLREEHAAKGSLVFETGPRSIRPVGLQGWLTIEMAQAIGLTPSLLTIPKSSPSAKNRYVLYPTFLTLLPSSLLSALSSLLTVPLLRSTLPGILMEPFRPRSPQHDLADGGDESVDAFFARRFGKPLASNMISAMIHGIYAGDTRRLSVRALFPGVWEAEREWGSVIRAVVFGGMWRRRGWAPKSEYRRIVEEEQREMEVVKALVGARQGGGDLVRRMESSSVWGVKGGLEVLTTELRNWLEKEGVEVRTGAAGTIESATFADGHWILRTPFATLHATHLIVTQPSLLPPTLAPPPLPSTTVSVVNLALPSPSLLPPGFGYLIPRTVPLSHNPHHVLGTIFDSDVMPGMDRSAEAGLTKLSILLGGSYWLDGLPKSLPSHETLVSWAMETLRLHFPTLDFPAPEYTLSHTHIDCIPQVPVGYFRELRKFGDRLRAEQTVAVVGGGMGGVGVNGAVKGAWEVGTSFAESVNSGTGSTKTGVEMWE